jgi:class 3 adenylate cyclase/pimeloyl-ACP methyl ester carboxylesterase
MDVPEVLYVKTPDGSHLAYQAFGDGPFDLVFVPGFASNVEHMWRIEPFARGLRRLGTLARVVVFDRRGTGLSDRIERAASPTLEAQMDDVRTVMDAAGIERAALFGFEYGANLCTVFAAAVPSRVFACVLHGSEARGLRAHDYPWAWSSDEWDTYLDDVDRTWGSQTMADWLARHAYPSHAHDASFRRELASFLRSAASPGAALIFERLLRDTDIRDVLAAIQVPVLVTHRVDDTEASVECARHLAANIPGARLLELDGADHYPFSGDQQPLLDAVERFLAAAHGAEVDFDRVLATVLFTDIVGSTEIAARMADRAWRDLIASHHRRVRSILARFRGREVDVAGDGFLAVFDGPARAVRCGLAICEDARALGLDVRVGIHTGEVELDGQAVRGIAVHIGSRVASRAGAGEVLVSSTVRDLVAGSGLAFESRGQHELKGVPGAWQVYAASAPDPGAGG